MNTPFSTRSRRTDDGLATLPDGRPSDLDADVSPFWSPVVIRVDTAGDRSSLKRLAELDSTDVPTGATLIAELRERPVAALSLDDGKAIADPFVATGGLLALLRLRAQQLNAHRVAPARGAPAPRLTPRPLLTTGRRRQGLDADSCF